ncbi:MAG: tetratricopeptide repeat protein [Planctomycetes bacterium]|nr:tetratricopeptide repeat protein [Planctomycetota bacterium]
MPASTPISSPTGPGPLRPLAIHAGFVAVVLATFWPALFGDYVHDDLHLIARNGAMLRGDAAAMFTQPLFDMEHGYWRPATMLMFFLGHHTAGAVGVHALSLLLHVLNCMAGFALARRMLAPTPALLATLVFAVHPVHTESLAWGASLNDPLWVLFALQAMLAALRWRDRERRGPPWLVGLLVIGAVLAKETGVTTVPLVLAALAFVPTANGHRPRMRLATAAITMITGLFLWLVLRAVVFSEAVGAIVLGNNEPTPAATGIANLVRAPELLLRHLGLLVMPLPATPFRALPPASVPLLLASIGASIAIAAVLWWRRGRLLPPTRIGLCLLLIPLLAPMLHFRSIGAHPICDRYLYLSVLGTAICIAGWLRGRWLWLLMIAALAMAPVSRSLCHNWHDADHLTAHVLATSPEDPTVLTLAGDLDLTKAQAGDPARFASARAYYQRAIDNTPPQQNGIVRRTLSAGRLGVAWCMLFEPKPKPPPPEVLIAAFQAAVDAGPENAAAWIGLGVANGVVGRTHDADAAFRRAIEIDPHHAEGWHNLAHLQFLTGKRQEARASLAEALRCDPNYAPSLGLLQQLNGN